jgi:hypothetical protein
MAHALEHRYRGNELLKVGYMKIQQSQTLGI